jgi:hypothetical protein
VGQLEGKRPLGGQTGGRMMLKSILKKFDWGLAWTGLIWLRIGAGGRL